MSETRNLLVKRRAEVTAKLPELEVAAQTKRREWLEALDTWGAAKEELRKIDVMLNSLNEEDAKSAHPTIMASVLEVLRQRPDGMTALEILNEINARYFDSRILRTSLSPQLSRLKDRDHKITLRGNRWFLLDEQPSLFRQKS